METDYTREDQVCRFVVQASISPAVLLNEKAFKDFTNQQVEDHGLPSYNP